MAASPVLTMQQRTMLEDIAPQVRAMIASELNRRLWARPSFDDLLSDALTRTVASAAKNRIISARQVLSRARSCALDALKSLARSLAKSLELHDPAVLAEMIGTADATDNEEPQVTRSRSRHCWAVQDAATGHLIAASFAFDR